MEQYLTENGIEHQLTVQHSLSQKGVVERKIRSNLEMTRSMLLKAKLPHKFWGEAISIASHLQNRLPTKSNDKTPYEVWLNRKLNVHLLKVFDCTIYAYILKSKREN